MHGIMHEHHVVPRSCGGTRTLPLCEACHGKVHGKNMLSSNLTKAALAVRRAQGKATSHAPWGYLAAEDGTLVPNPHEQAIAERARALRAEGLSFHRILAQLTAEGYRSRRGNALAYDAVYKMVTGWRRNRSNERDQP
jgi:hypothetical protein